MVRSRMAVRRRGNPLARVSWAALTVAPWFLAGSLLVSFVADAGQEPVIGATRVDLTDLAPAEPDDLVPVVSGLGERGFALPAADAAVRSIHAAAREGDARPPEDDEVAPRAVPKAGRTEMPSVEPAGRQDPFVPVRASFDAPLRTTGSLERFRVADLAFGDRDAAERPLGFVAMPVDAPWPDASHLEPLPRGLAVTTRPTRSEASPQTSAGDVTPHVQDGSTPSVARAVSLASATPAPSDATPIEISALPKFSRGPNGLNTSNDTMVGVAQYHPDYAALIETARSASEQRCLAQAVYFEARSEPEEGQAAVAQVVLNRALSGLYPGSVCGVVFQNQQRHNACQFSFACEGHGLRVSETQSWANAVRIAQEVTDGATYVSDVGASTHYHANYVTPFWAHSLKRMDVIGHHIFYTLKPGQT